MRDSRFRIGCMLNTNYCLLIISVLALIICPLPGLSDPISQNDLDALQTQLKQTGWTVQRSPSGDLLLWPAGKETGAQPQAVPKDDDRVPITDLETLENRLQDSGWRVEQDIDKSLLIYPKEEGPGEGGKSNKENSSERMNDLHRLLTDSGWQVTKSKEGDLLLYPSQEASSQEAPSQEAPSQVAIEPASSKETDLYVKPSELLHVRDILTKAGWRLEEESDGSILLFSESSDKSEPVEKEGKRYVPGIVVSSLIRREIELPVDSRDEVLRISNSWLADQQAKGLVIGKIRKINWIYLVSIVEDSEPYLLNNQLVIREKDGTVIPLH